MDKQLGVKNSLYCDELLLNWLVNLVRCMFSGGEEFQDRSCNEAYRNISSFSSVTNVLHPIQKILEIAKIQYTKLSLSLIVADGTFG